MKKSALCLLIFLVWLCVFPASAEETALPGPMAFGGTKDDTLYHAIALENGNFLLVGSASSKDGDVSARADAKTGEDAWAVCVDASGKIVWSYLSDDPNPSDHFQYAAALPDGRVALLHNYLYNDRMRSKVEILSADGVFEQEIKTTNGAEALVANEKGMYLVGFRTVKNPEPNPVLNPIDIPYARRVEWKGKVNWEHQYTRESLVTTQFLGAVAAGDGVIAYGSTVPRDTYRRAGIVVQLTADGKTAFRYVTQQRLDTKPLCCAPAPGGGVFLADVRTNEVILSRLDAEGKLLFEKQQPVESAGLTLESSAVIASGDGLLIGSMLTVSDKNSESYQHMMLRLIRVGAAGEILASKATERPAGERVSLSGFLQGADGKLYVYGTMLRSPDAGGKTGFWLAPAEAP